MVKSPDAFRTISEVSDWLDRPTHVLRFWESKFPQIKPVKRAGGRRYYRPQDMLLLGGIKRLLHDDGMTIKGVQKLLREQGIAHVVSLSQPLDDDLAAALAAMPPEADTLTSAPGEAPMDVMAQDIRPAGATVLAFPDPVAREAPPTAPVALPKPVIAAAVRPAQDHNATAAETYADTPSDPKPASLTDAQPSLPFDLPDMVPPPATTRATEETAGAKAHWPDLPADPATAAPGLLAAVIGRTAAPLPAASRAALLPLVRQLVPVARRMRQPPVSPE